MKTQRKNVKGFQMMQYLSLTFTTKSSKSLFNSRSKLSPQENQMIHQAHQNFTTMEANANKKLQKISNCRPTHKLHPTEKNSSYSIRQQYILCKIRRRVDNYR